VLSLSSASQVIRPGGLRVTPEHHAQNWGGHETRLGSRVGRVGHNALSSLFLSSLFAVIQEEGANGASPAYHPGLVVCVASEPRDFHSRHHGQRGVHLQV
jgi:hypothetical protein